MKGQLDTKRSNATNDHDGVMITRPPRSVLEHHGTFLIVHEG